MPAETKGVKLREKPIAYCSTCGHSHHHEMGLLAEGRPRCNTTIQLISMSEWLGYARDRPHKLTAAGRSALAAYERGQDSHDR